MPDREFIHSRGDVQDALRFAWTIGLHVLPDAARANDVTNALSPEALDSVDRGVFQLYRPDWVMAPLQVMRIDTGANAGKYVVKPGVNFAAITIYFQGEGVLEGKRRFGSGTISFKRQWLQSATNEMRSAPVGIAQHYAKMCRHLLSRIVVRAGVHRYSVARHAAQLASTEQTYPPFDFIPWPPNTSSQRSRFS